jgi:hypothetical protein
VSIFAVGALPLQVALVSLISARGRQQSTEAGLVSRSRLPTDAVGTTTLTLTNVVPGSRYRIERQGDGSLATPTGNAEGVAGASTVAITLDYYAGGSANNDLKIKVRKATSGTSYKPFETQTTIGANPQSIYVGQIADE